MEVKMEEKIENNYKPCGEVNDISGNIRICFSKFMDNELKEFCMTGITKVDVASKTK